MSEYLTGVIESVQKNCGDFDDGRESHMTRIRCSLQLLVVMVLYAHLPSLALAQSPKDVARKVAPSVVLLVMEDSNGQPLTMGSGFAIKDGIVATNLHVIEGAARGYAKLPDKKEKLNVMGVVASDAVRDIVLLAVEDLKAPPLPLGDSKQIVVGDEVYAVGNPRGLEGTFSAGIISGIRKIGEDSLLQITTPISPGSSGGPVVNKNGEVVGVAVATFKGGQNLNFAIPSAYVSSLAEQIKAASPLDKAGSDGKQAKPKSILDDLGGRNTEAVAVGSFLWEYPSLDIGSFSLSFRNQLQQPIEKVACLLIFYDGEGLPVETSLVECYGIVRPGLARRVTGSVDGSVQKLTTKGADTARQQLEFRVLSFDLVTGDELQQDK